MINDFWNWLNGYVVIKFKGSDVEVLLNRIIEKGIVLWGVERLTIDIVIARLSTKNFAKLRPLLRGLVVDVNIIGKHGLPFRLAIWRKRQFLVIGFLLFCGLIYYLSGFVWFIQITGTESVSNDEILSIVVKEGIERGLPKEDFSGKSLEKAILTQLDELAWVGVNLKGSLVKIDVVERSVPDQEIVRPGNLVAARDGLINHVLTFRGTPYVQGGDTVRQGELLISGEYYDIYGNRQQGRAEGIVRARVWYESVGEAAFTKITQKHTGNTQTGYAISIGNFSFKFPKSEPFKMYHIDSHAFGEQVRGFKIPLSIHKYDYYEVEYQTISIPYKQAKETATERAWESLETQGITKEDVSYFELQEYDILDEYGIRVNLFVEVEKNIAKFVGDH